MPQHDVDSNAHQPDRFEQLYKSNCSACHGERGDGKSRAQFGLNPPPRDFTSEMAKEELSRERMITSVTFGRPGTAMVGWGKRLENDEIEGVVDYIRSAFMVAALQDSVEPIKAIAEHPGKIVYKEHCAVCHGDKGSGATWTQSGLNPPPRDFTAAESREQLTPERMTSSITFGRPGTAMMPFKTRLTPEQIASVVDYIRTSFIEGGGGEESSEAPVDDEYAAMPGFGNIPHGAEHSRTESVPAQAPTAVPVDMSLPLPHDLVGDPEKGRQFYTHNCFTCHGLEGNGKGPRSKFIHPPPRNFIAATSRQMLNRPALFKAIFSGIPGTVMPSWGKVLSDQEIANVAEYVFQTFIQASNESGSAQDVSISETASQKKKVIRN